MGRRAEDGDEADKVLSQINALARNWKGLAVLLALTGGTGTALDVFSPFSGGGSQVSDLEMEIDELQATVAVLRSEQNSERELRELGVNGNTLQINNLRNRIAVVERASARTVARNKLQICRRSTRCCAYTDRRSLNAFEIRTSRSTRRLPTV